MNSWWPGVAIGLASGVLGGWAADRNVLFACWYFGFWTVSCTALAALNAVLGNWPWAALTAVLAALNAWWWHKFWNRRRRKRAGALAGAKSRARVAALVAKARAAARPRRVLREPA